ncbi:HAMP domain-containing protein [Pseudenhygromyxa sp. WMMC2535]|uniref:sensor histidine kinase n=1 Tax=Pseudenhygromyxa sp. WMMC2535 TaxID=2712867 RepID=UPI00155564B3|nr:ATP-binding protein [Pseudenhygromyxa sp. WMMC2535]NVB38498.1 HAMP domain-containing protein [Pseudenhygromyxa sp. WMMC2535]
MAERRSSLRLELIATLAIVLVMAVISLSLTAEWLGQRRHDEQEVERLRSYARQLAILSGGSFRGGDFERDGLEDLLADAAGLQGTSIEIHRMRSDGSFERVAAVGVHAGFEDLPAPAPQLRAAVDDSLLDRWNLVIVDEPVPTFDSSQKVLLRLIAEHSPWTRGHDWRETLIVAGGVGLLLLLIGGGLLELQVLRPMRALGQAVADFGEGRGRAQAPLDGPAELRELAERFNQMVASLREQQDALEAQRGRLERSERLAAVGRVAAGVAHEVGNPLAAIVGYTELLLGEPGLDAPARDLLQRVGTQTQRIQGIVAQLLDYSKPAPAKLEVVAVVARVQEVIALLRADPRCAGVEFEVAGDPELCVRADPGLIEQILINLVLNAARAALEASRGGEGQGGAQGEGPRVEVRVRSAEVAEASMIAERRRPASELEVGGARGGAEMIAVEVQDNGPGVPEAVRERLFEPFFTTRAAGEGTGLGLAISQGLAERMEGSLSYVPSKPPGARFRLELPRAAGG